MGLFFRQVARGFSLVTLCVLLVPATVFVCIVGGFIFLPLPANLPEPNPVQASQATRVYDFDGNEIAVLRKFDQNIPIKQEDIPEVLKQAVISMEDRNFYRHSGVDIRGSLRALYADIRNKQLVQGGSTITQQYVKGAYTNQERTISRKIREAILASQLDRQVPKEEILYRYLSHIYLGSGAYGVGAASETYFRKPVSQLNASEAAVIAGLIPAPSQWAPRDNPSESEFRRKLVLQAMLGEGYLDKSAYDSFVAQPIWLESQGPPPGPVTLIYNDRKPVAQYPYFVSYVESYLKMRYGEDAVYRGGLRVQTTIDPATQAAAQAAVGGALNGTSPPLSMALASVEPQTGFVRAMVGGRDFQQNQVNLALGGCPRRPVASDKTPMAVQVEPTCWHEEIVTNGGSGRQPGSAFKPFVLAAAYEKGIQPSKVYSAPTVYVPPGCRGPTCAIHNYEGGSFGPTSIKEAMASSINTVYAPLTRDVGFVETANMAKKLGVASAYYSQEFHRTNGNYGLGVVDVSPLDMAAAYSVFANRGLRLPATPVVKVADISGRVLEDNTSREPVRVIDEAVADNVTDALRGVIDRGTGSANGRIGRPAAGKTGTTEDYRDAWFVGYTPTLSTSVWMGYSDSARTINYKGNRRISGGTVPTATWSAFMREALKDVPPTQFSEPAPIQKPVTDVVSAPNAAEGPTAIAPRTRRPPTQTPGGSYDRTDSAPPAVSAPTTTTTTSPAPSGSLQPLGAPIRSR